MVRAELPAAVLADSARLLATAEPPAPYLLIVDAHDPSRSALAALLRDRGHRVRESGNALETLPIAREQPPALLIVDLWPFISASLQMIARVRHDAAITGIPVIVLTSALASRYRERAFAAGCAAYLEKPCPAAAILGEIGRLLAPSAPRTPTSMIPARWTARA